MICIHNCFPRVVPPGGGVIGRPGLFAHHVKALTLRISMQEIVHTYTTCRLLPHDSGYAAIRR
jgi:hypothetical protein